MRIHCHVCHGNFPVGSGHACSGTKTPCSDICYEEERPAMDEGNAYKIDDLPKGAVIEAVDAGGLGYQVLLPDGTRIFVSIVPGDPISVVKTVFPADAPISIELGKAEKQ